MFKSIVDLLNSEHLIQLMLMSSLYFLMIYFIFALLAKGVAYRVNRPISLKPLHQSQIRIEMLRSLRSIMIFGIGMILPWAMLRFGLVNIMFEVSLSTIVIELLFLIVWNDIHFYAIHRLMHTKFKKAHGIHHQSITSTPFSAYSLSGTEAALLGSVMPLVMPFYAFSIQALILLPIWSIFINTLAHSNSDLFPNVRTNSMLGFIRHHQHHHSYYQGHYSFFIYQLDHWFGTAQPLKEQRK